MCILYLECLWLVHLILYVNIPGHGKTESARHITVISHQVVTCLQFVV